MSPLRQRGQPDGFVWVPTYQGTAWISDESLVRLDRAFTLAKRALEHECCCGGVGCRWTEDEAKIALVALNELLSPPAKEEPK